MKNVSINLFLFVTAILCAGSVAHAQQACSDLFIASAPKYHLEAFEKFDALAKDSDPRPEISALNQEAVNRWLGSLYPSPLADKMKGLAANLNPVSYDFLKFVSVAGVFAPKARAEAIQRFVMDEMQTDPKLLFILGGTSMEDKRTELKNRVEEVAVALTEKFANLDPAKLKADGLEASLADIFNAVNRERTFEVPLSPRYSLTQLEILMRFHSAVQTTYFTSTVTADVLRNKMNPEGLFVIDMDNIGIRAINSFTRRGLSLFGVVDRDTKVDGTVMKIISFFKHDLAHAELIKARVQEWLARGFELRPYDLVVAGLSVGDRVKFDLIDFFAFHEIFPLANMRDSSSYQIVSAIGLMEMVKASSPTGSFEQKVQHAREILKREVTIHSTLFDMLKNPSHFGVLLPVSLRYKKGESDKGFEQRVTDYLYDAFAVWTVKNL